MITLVCNAAEGTLDIILGKGHEILCAHKWHTASRGTEILTPALQDMLARLHMQPKDIQRVACVLGPGSFTGLRLCLATALALRRALGIPLAGLDYMHTLAIRGQYLQYMAGREGHIWVLTHARRHIVHCQCFAVAEDITIPPLPISPVELISITDLIPRLQAAPEGSVMLGSGVARHHEDLHQTAVTILPETQPQAVDLWAAACNAVYAHVDIEPLYIRPCDVIDSLNHTDKAHLAKLLTAPITVHEA